MGWSAREAVLEDAEEIARINVAGWRAHYPNLMPQEVLDGLDEAAIAETYRELLTAAPVAGRALFVAVDGGRIGAFCGVCPARNPGRDAHPTLRTAELAAIYADPACVGSGAGHAVHDAGAWPRQASSRRCSGWSTATASRTGSPSPRLGAGRRHGQLPHPWPRCADVQVQPPAPTWSGRSLTDQGRLTGSPPLPGAADDFRTELHRQLDALGVHLVLGTSLRGEPPSEAGEAKSFTATTRSGRESTADIWFGCFGGTPATGYLAGELATARHDTGHFEVNPELRVPGQDHVFAIGDLAALPEAKMAAAAGQHAEVVAANIRSLINGGRALTLHQPAPPGISLPLGPTGGASYAPHVGVLGVARTAQLKCADLKTGMYLELLGLDNRRPRRRTVIKKGAWHGERPHDPRDRSDG